LDTTGDRNETRCEDHGPFRAELQPHYCRRGFAAAGFGGAIAIDVTGKQVAGERVTWAARWQPDAAVPPVRGVIEAEFDRDRVTALQLTGAP
jgi:hypothetical protein